jgi:hypothetical protein
MDTTTEEHDRSGGSGNADTETWSDTDVENEDISTIDAEDRDTITVNVTVDVSDLDADDTAVLTELASQYENGFREVVQKNRDYGMSFLRTGEKLAATPADPFENATRSQAYGLLTRSGDKRERLIENVYGDGDAAVSDSPAQTAAEAANYYHFLAFVLGNPDLASGFLDE